MADELAALVSRHPFFAAFPPSIAALCLEGARITTFPVGAHLLREGEPADTCYLVQRGRVALELFAPKGAITIETIGDGDVLGWSWLFPPYRWVLDARALEPVEAIALDTAVLRERARSDALFGRALLERVSAVVVERLQATRLRLLDLYGGDRAS